MAPVVPDPPKIKSFRTEAAFAAWMKANPARETELWLKIHKKGSGLPTVTNAQAIDVALCWGWIDGIRKSFDERSFLQRFTPRRARSIWSQNNRDHVARLIAAGRMTPHGQRQVDAARADGRWDAGEQVQRDERPPRGLRGPRVRPAGQFRADRFRQPRVHDSRFARGLEHHHRLYEESRKGPMVPYTASLLPYSMAGSAVNFYRPEN